MMSAPGKQLLKAHALALAVAERAEKGFTARVHSVHHSCVNCLTETDDFLVIACRQLGEGPDTILLNESCWPDFSGMAAGMWVEVDRMRLSIVAARLEISFAGADCWRPMLFATETEAPAERVLANLAALQRLALAEGSMNGLGLLLPSLTAIFPPGASEVTYARQSLCELAFPALALLVKAILVEDIKLADDSLSRLIGLGIGLTPSADDIITGMMGSLLFAQGQSGRSKFFHDLAGAIERIATERTTFVSRKALEHAAKGELHQNLSLLVNAILTGDRVRLGAYARKVIAMGSSSGTELVIGIILGLWLHLRRKSRQVRYQARVS